MPLRQTKLATAFSGFICRTVTPLFLLVVLLTAGCGSTNEETAPVAAEPATATPTAAAEVTTATPTAEPEAATPLPVEEEPVAELEAAVEQWEEGPITFKSDSLHGNATASGEPFDKDSLTAAHKELPFDTEVTVINPANGKRVTVRINDRLPPQVSAIIDLSPAAAHEIDMVDAGIIEGRIEW